VADCGQAGGSDPDPVLLNASPAAAGTPRLGERPAKKETNDEDDRTSCRSPAFERTSQRRGGFPSETQVKRGLRFVRGGEKELIGKLGRNDPCPCGSGARFQALLHALGPVSTARREMIIGGERCPDC
jgi:hypothetical protein